MLLIHGQQLGQAPSVVWFYVAFLHSSTRMWLLYGHCPRLGQAWLSLGRSWASPFPQGHHANRQLQCQLAWLVECVNTCASQHKPCYVWCDVAGVIQKRALRSVLTCVWVCVGMRVCGDAAWLWMRPMRAPGDRSRFKVHQCWRLQHLTSRQLLWVLPCAVWQQRAQAACNACAVP